MLSILNRNRKNEKIALTFYIKITNSKRRIFNITRKILVDAETKRFLKIKKITLIESSSYRTKKKINLILTALVLAQKKNRIRKTKFLEKKTILV